MDHFALDALLEGSQAWISYRDAMPPKDRPDLPGVDLGNRDLTGRDLSRANLMGARFQEANLTGVNLQDADLTGAYLQEANLMGANLQDAELTDANLTDAKLQGADLQGANLTGANLQDADLTDAELGGADLIQVVLVAADLVGADLTGANLTGANLAGANLTDADLTRANLTRATLTQANLSDADLTRANLTDANLSEADFRHANLAEADLSRALLSNTRLTDVNFAWADLTGADFSGASLAGSDLSGANLTNARITSANLVRLKVNPDTVTAAGQTLLDTLRVGARNDIIDADVVRLQVELPPDVSPQTLADLTSSVAIMARLTSQVGSRLHEERLGERPFDSGGALLVATDGPASFVTVRRTHYGSPWWADLVEHVPSIVHGGAAVASTLLLRKHGQGLLSFLLTLARREERELWLRARVEHQRAELEKGRANAASETERRMKIETNVTKLQIKAASQSEFQQRVTDSVPNVDLQIAIHDAIPGLMPLIGNGLTVITAAEEDGNNQRQATVPNQRS